MKSEGVSLTTNELASVLALCGYETMASQILNSINLKESTDVFERFIKDTELSLKGKGILGRKQEYDACFRFGRSYAYSCSIEEKD